MSIPERPPHSLPGRPDEPDPEPELGWVATEVRAEFPELALMSVTLAATTGARSPRSVRDRLRRLSDRWAGAQAMALRQEAVAGAYRIFFRHIGLDPDDTRTPLEAAVLERMVRGGFASRGLLADALLIGMIETRTPIWALDTDTVQGPLGIRVAAEGEALGRAATPAALAGGSLVVADAAGALAVLFGTIGAGHVATDATRRLTLFSIKVAGVPSVHIEEALWTCSEILGDAA